MSEKVYPVITHQMIINMTNSIYLERGKDYQKKGMVKQGWIIDNYIKAKVRGNCKSYYLVQIAMHNNNTITGNCTCPIGFSCKHCVAVCLQYLNYPEAFKNLSPSEFPTLKEGFKQKEDHIIISKEFKHKSMSVQTWISTLSVEELKRKFLELWNRFSPNLLVNLLEPNYPFWFWVSQFDDIVSFDKPKTDKFESLSKVPSQTWFTPLELLEFLNDPNLFTPVLHNWTQSYINLGRQLKSELNSIGISETLIDFDLNFYFSLEYERDFYETKWGYYDDYDSILESLADNYFIQFKSPIIEMTRFYKILQQNKLVDLADNLLEFGLKWLIELNLEEYQDVGLDELYEIQRQVIDQIGQT